MEALVEAPARGFFWIDLAAFTSLRALFLPLAVVLVTRVLGII